MSPLAFGNAAKLGEPVGAGRVDLVATPAGAPAGVRPPGRGVAFVRAAFNR